MAIDSVANQTSPSTEEVAMPVIIENLPRFDDDRALAAGFAAAQSIVAADCGLLVPCQIGVNLKLGRPGDKYWVARRAPLRRDVPLVVPFAGHVGELMFEHNNSLDAVDLGVIEWRLSATEQAIMLADSVSAQTAMEEAIAVLKKHQVALARIRVHLHRYGIYPAKELTKLLRKEFGRQFPSKQLMT